MTTETEDVSPEDVFWKKLIEAHQAAGSPTVGMILVKAQQAGYYDLDPKSVENWLKQQHIPRVKDTTELQPFQVFLKVLKAGDLTVWAPLARAAQRAKTQRLKAEEEQRREDTPPPAGTATPDDEAEHDATETARPSNSAGTISGPAAAVPAGPADDTGEDQPSLLLEPTTDHHDEETQPPPPSSATTQAETTKALGAGEPGPHDGRPPRRWKPSIPLTTGAAVVLIAATVVIVAPWEDDSTSSTGTPPATSGESQARGGGPQPGELTSFEAPLNDSKTAGAPPIKTLGVWTKPSMNLDCHVSPCLDGTRQIAKVTLPETVTVVCVATGQMIRNGTPGDAGYYEDNRWVHIAPHPNISQVGYLSNVWFARNELPANLATCPS